MSKPIKTRGMIPQGIYTNENGDQLKVTWEEFDTQAYAEALKKEVKKHEQRKED